MQPIGYFKIWRELLTKPIWLKSTPEQKTILITLLGMVHFAPKKWEWNGQPFSCEPGQIITSLNTIRENCGDGVTIQNVRTALKRFENLQFLTNQSTKTGRLITIGNWDIYQGNDDTPNKDSNSCLTKSQQRPNKRLTPREESKESKKDKKGNNNSSSNAFTADSIEMSLVNKFLFLIRCNNPNFKEPNVQKWAKDFNSIIRLDKRSPEEIEAVMTWAQQDNFWKANILSPEKLRDKYDALFMKMNLNTDKPIPKGFASIQRSVRGE